MRYFEVKYMEIKKEITYNIQMSEKELLTLSHILWTMKYNVNTDATTQRYAAEYKEIIDKATI